MANWNWKVVRQFVSERFGKLLSSRSGLNYLHRLGFVVKRPRFGEQATCYSAVCLETGEVEALSVPGTTHVETSVAFLKQCTRSILNRSL